MNNSLLQEKEYVTMITNFLEQTTEEGEDIDQRLHWDVLKMQLWRETLKYAVNRARKSRQQSADLEEEITFLEHRISEDEACSDETIEI